MTKEEIVTALLDDMEMPYLQDWQARDIVDFIIKNSKPSLSSNLDEAAEESAESWRKNPDGSESREIFFQPHIRGFKAGAEWMAGQGVTKETVIGMATEEISINVSQQTLEKLDLCSGDKVVVQIWKK